MQNNPQNQANTLLDHPLEMTVHDLPTNDLPEGAAGPATGSRTNRWAVWLILAVCAAPVIASYTAYYVVRPQNKVVHGDLIQPTVSTPHQEVRDLKGQARELSDLKGQWLFMSVGGGACDAQCQERLYLQRQLIVSLGAEKDRVDWVWLINDDAPVDEKILPALQSAQVLRVPNSVLQAWLKPAPGQTLESSFYLVDPQGEWMERFGVSSEREQVANVKKDLNRLLSASASWDRAGRD
jgi:cytochrome oxidase Cu insertion factor (SCO1/SenC/PrrC family)